MTTPHSPADDRVRQIREALGEVMDPEIHQPITDLGMVDDISVDAEGVARVQVLVTIEGCPMRDRIERETAEAAATVPGLSRVEVDSRAMSEEQRRELTARLRQGRRQIPFNQAGSLTRIFAVSSGKGGVGKSTVTANLAAAMAAQGLRVGVIDADIHGFSMPGMFGITEQPTKVSDLLMPPQAHGVAVMSIGMFVPEGQAVVWRGPKMHRAIEQFASDVYWGDLDVLLLDLPPGTGDVAISVAQLLPGAKMLVVTTPQQSAAAVAERVGSLATATGQEIAGVVENMAGLTLPDGSVMDVFGRGGGDRVAATLAGAVKHPVPVLGRVPLEPPLREGADAGIPLVVSDPESPAAKSLIEIARVLTHQPRGLGGMKLPLSVAGGR
ncbi:Mrp/NBP35 family ATP-binding protein [Brachybacterium muris]|uniref:P-loop NTPase n=1 Tax=Brachybacterium muris TaxID=219301 RepID=UPI00195B888D|nr:ATP-binding protein involved in chromosome partitioning [Brachybacterium muris]MCT1655186.1 Mrp/NBP35 family ATP-binding protein [Brachybacterium muris]MCT1998798.1 Mrp/NBP35 family ATP-binding protein [Brachybacterium muris]MCT2296238.1 Mrp/NBP35 family ATP-binding protein [Brachybacterium muris]